MKDKMPLGVIDSLNAGFGTLAQKPFLLLIPILLDLFLWFGPRLSATPKVLADVCQGIVPELTTRLQALTSQSADTSAEIFGQTLEEILGSYNLFSALSTWPLGAPSLLAGNEPGTNPLGTNPVLKVETLGGFLACLLLLVLLGLLLASLYFSLIARWVNGNPNSLRTWAMFIGLYWGRIVASVALVLVGVFFLSIPFFLIVEIVGLIFGPLALLILLAGTMAVIWGIFHLFFAVHSILIEDASIPKAMANSIRLVRRYPHSAVGLLLAAMLISLGLGKIWHMPPSESWTRLIGILGNAFINTGLVTATFVYYRERNLKP